MQEIKKLGILSVTRISLLFGAASGILAILYLGVLSRLPIDTITAMGLPSVTLSATLILTTILWSVVMYGIGGLIVALLYNLFSKWVGGVKIDFTQTSVKKKK